MKILAATNVTGYPYAQISTRPSPGDEQGPLGLRVDHKKLIDMDAYLSGLEAPAGARVDRAAADRGEKMFRANCTTCHNVDQDKRVGPMIVPMKTIFPGDNPVVLAQREPPLNPVQDTPNSFFDDKMIVVNASIRKLERDIAIPSPAGSRAQARLPARQLGPRSRNAVRSEAWAERASSVLCRRGRGNGGTSSPC